MGFLWIGASSGREIAATVVSPGGSRVVFARVVAEIFVVTWSAFARLNSIAIGSCAGLPVGQLCVE